MQSKIPEEAKEDLIRKKIAGASWVELAEWLLTYFDVKIDRTNIARWYNTEINIQNVNPDSLEQDRVRDRISLDARIATYRAKLNQVTRQYNELLKKDSSMESLITAIRENTIPFPKLTPVKYKKPTGKIRGESAQVVVAPLSDTHIGEIVDSKQMTGLNRYDMEIFNNRLYGWATTVLNLVNLKRNSVPVDELVIPMLGDIISGDIHDELMLTNEDHLVGQMIRGAHLISQAILYLSPHFKKIRIPCVVGNHGRMFRQKPMKNKGILDWDHILYQFVAAFCKSQPHIEFHIPTSYFTTFKIHDKNILIMHGDSASGGGAATSITRAVTNLRSVLHYRHSLAPETYDASTDNVTTSNTLPHNFDSAFIGHFHRIDEWDIGTGQVYICGTMKGGDEYAFFRMGVISQPLHILSYFHPKMGMICKETIFLAQFDNKPSKFKDVLPEIWAHSSAIP